MSGPALQLSLFDTEEPQPRVTHSSVENITWSFGRRTTLERCARRYYYTYFGANKRTAKEDPEKETLHLLKKVATRHERAGAILHLGIARYLRQAREGNPLGLDRLLGWAKWVFDSDRNYSRANPDGGGIGAESKFPPVLLREYHYREPTADGLAEEAEIRLLEALRAFVTEPCFASFRAGATGPGALIEHPFHLRSLPCKAEGRIDLAYENEAGPVVVDWKIGEADGSGAESLQLAVYALWAASHYGCTPSVVRSYWAHLSSRDAVEFPANAATLAAAQARIIQDAERMAAVETYGRQGIAEAFTPCAYPSVCRLCPFQEICPEGKQFLNA